MNLKYCHFTFPPSSPSLLLSDFPLSYLSSRHHHHHHLLHKRSPTRSLSLSNTHPLRCTVICFSFPFFLSNPLSSPLPTKPGVSLLAHFSFVLAHHFTPTPLQTFPQRFPRSFSPPRTGAPPPPSPLHTLVLAFSSSPPTIDAPGRICKFRLNGIGGDDKSNGNRKSQ